MKYLLLTILLLSCSGRSVTKIDPVVEPEAIQDTLSQSFVLAMPFEGGPGYVDTVVPPVMPVWVPVIDKPNIVKANLKEKYVEYDSLFDESIARLRKRLNDFDTPIIVHDTVTVQKIVHSRGLAYLMLVIGFVTGFVVAFILTCFTSKSDSGLLHWSEKEQNKAKSKLRSLNTK